MEQAASPLDGLRVLELGQLIAGPFCGQLLADFGADVVKIEPPGRGDPMRAWGIGGENDEPVWWSVIARDKRSLTLDLREADGQALLRDLAARADILVENFRPGTMERWGLGPDVLADVNQRLIVVRVSGFGQTGPYAERAGYASVCEAFGGLRYISGYPDRPPVRVGLSLGDSLAGQSAFTGALLALHARKATGRGQVVDTSIFESVLAMTESLIADYDRHAHVRERTGSTLPGIAPSNAYPTDDGREIVIGANQDTVFRRLCEVMERPELADDPRFADHRARGEHQQVLDDLIAAWTRRQSADSLVERLAEAGVPAGLAYSAREMLDDPHFAARDAIVRAPDADGRSLAMQAVFPRLSDTPGRIRRGGPALGEHTDAVLREWLDLSDERLRTLHDDGIL